MVRPQLGEGEKDVKSEEPEEGEGRQAQEKEGVERRRSVEGGGEDVSVVIRQPRYNL